MPDEQVTSGSTTTAAPGAGWEQLPPSPLSPRGGAVLTELDDGRLLVVGGDTSPGCHDTLVVPQDQSGDTSSSGASSGAAVVSASTAALDCAGPEKETRLRDGAILDSASGSWRPMAEAPAPLSDPTRPVVIGDVVYVWAWPSFVQGAPQHGVWMSYDVKADSWRRLADPPLGEHPYIGVVPAGDRLIAYRTSEEFGEKGDLIYDPATDSWSDLPTDPLSLSFDRFMVPTDDEVVLLARELVPNPGSERPSLVRAAAWDPETHEWRRLPDSEVIGGYDSWSWTAKRVVNPERDSFDGGESGNYGKYYSAGGMLDPATGEWSELPEPPQGQADCKSDNSGLGETPRERGAGPEAVVLNGWALHVAEERWERVPCNEKRADFAYASTWAFDGVVTFGGYDAVAEPGQFPTDYKFKNDTWLWRPAK